MAQTKNLTDEEIKKLKKSFYKTLSSLKSRNVFTEAYYEQMNSIADDFTNELYRLIDKVWQRNEGKGEKND